MSKLNRSVRFLAILLLFPLLAARDASARTIQGAFLDTSLQAATGFDDKKPQGDQEAVIATVGDPCEAVVQLLVANEFDKAEVDDQGLYQEPAILVAAKFDKELHQGEDEALLVGVVIKYFMLDEKIVTFTSRTTSSHSPHSEKQQTMKLFAVSISFSANNQLFKYFSFVKDLMYFFEQVSKWFPFVF